MLRLIVLIIIGILVLSFFGVSIQNLVHSPTTQANFAFLWHTFLDALNQLVAFAQQSIYEALAYAQQKL